MGKLGTWHDDVIKWKHFPRNWPFVWGIHRSPVNSSHKGQWRGALMFSLIGVWINGWVNNREAGDLRRYRAHYDVTVMNPQEMIAQQNKAQQNHWNMLWMSIDTLLFTFNGNKCTRGIRKKISKSQNMSRRPGDREGNELLCQMCIVPVIGWFPSNYIFKEADNIELDTATYSVMG